jgi:hypothetical protein
MGIGPGKNEVIEQNKLNKGDNRLAKLMFSDLTIWIPLKLILGAKTSKLNSAQTDESLAIKAN